VLLISARYSVARPVVINWICPHTSQSPAVNDMAPTDALTPLLSGNPVVQVCVPDCVPDVLIAVPAMAFATEDATLNVLAVIDDGIVQYTVLAVSPVGNAPEVVNTTGIHPVIPWAFQVTTAGDAMLIVTAENS